MTTPDPESQLENPTEGGPLRAALRQGAVPSTGWFAGLGFQMIALGWFSGAVIAAPLLETSFLHRAMRVIEPALSLLGGVEGVVMNLDDYPEYLWFWAPILFASFWLATGLVGTVAAGEPPSLLGSLRRGKGLVGSGLLLSLQFVLMMFISTLVFVGPVQMALKLFDLENVEVLTAILAGILVCLLLIYSVLLAVLFQLAFQSLASNRRGIGSAVLHSWKMAFARPRETLTAAFVDLGFGLALIAGYLVLVPASYPWWMWISSLLWVGMVGTVRVVYWNQIYRAFGGVAVASEEAPG